MFYFVGFILFCSILLYVFSGRLRNDNNPIRIGDIGEKIVAKELRRMGFSSCNGVFLSSRDGVTQIDHIAKVGNAIVVIETKNYKGLMYGRQSDKEWRQVFRRGKSFPVVNAVSQNYGHVQSVKAIVGEHIDVRGVVIFVGTAKFPKGRPEGVIIKDELADWLRNTFVDAGPNVNIDQAWEILVNEVKRRGGRNDKKEHLKTVKMAQNRVALITSSKRTEPIFDE